MPNETPGRGGEPLPIHRPHSQRFGICHGGEGSISCGRNGHVWLGRFPRNQDSLSPLAAPAPTGRITLEDSSPCVVEWHTLLPGSAY